MSQRENVAILDFGSQYTQLIARRLRELNVYAEIISPSTSSSQLLENKPKGIILSGGPNSPTESAIDFDPKILDLQIPILGICYGMQLMNHLKGGTLTKQGKGEYGKQRVTLKSDSRLFDGLQKDQDVWMSHGLAIQKIAESYQVKGVSKDGLIAAMEADNQFGLQFHPEVEHTSFGKKILDNFLSICGCARDWTMDSFIEESKTEIRKKVGKQKVVSLVSGGVDSTAATLLCLQALPKEQVIPIHVDTGLMRANESEQVMALMQEFRVHHIQAQELFLSALKGVTDPEEKRHIIGNLFVELMDREIRKIDQQENEVFLCQGTLYPDLVESGKGCGKHAAVIKSHHNVNPPFIKEKREKGLLIEPNAALFKDEVRRVCQALEVPDTLIWRHPFPGPGLAIRIMGEVTKERLERLRAADLIFLEEINKADLYRTIWQAFCVLIPINTVAVMGDERKVGQVIALRAVTSSDGMTAEAFHFPKEVLERISSRIVNEVPKISRVVLDITSKPPGTIEWE